MTEEKISKVEIVESLLNLESEFLTQDSNLFDQLGLGKVLLKMSEENLEDGELSYQNFLDKGSKLLSQLNFKEVISQHKK